MPRDRRQPGTQWPRSRPYTVRAGQRESIGTLWHGLTAHTSPAPKRAGPIIKADSFVLAWHLKDRHLVSRQRHLFVAHRPHPRHVSLQKQSTRLTNCFEKTEEVEPHWPRGNCASFNYTRMCIQQYRHGRWTQSPTTSHQPPATSQLHTLDDSFTYLCKWTATLPLPCACVLMHLHKQ